MWANEVTLSPNCLTGAFRGLPHPRPVVSGRPKEEGQRPVRRHMTCEHHVKAEQESGVPSISRQITLSWHDYLLSSRASLDRLRPVHAAPVRSLYTILHASSSCPPSIGPWLRVGIHDLRNDPAPVPTHAVVTAKLQSTAGSGPPILGPPFRSSAQDPVDESLQRKTGSL